MMFVYLNALIYSVSRYYDVTWLGISSNHSWWQAITYNFTHVSFFHLVVNMWGYMAYRNSVVKSYGLWGTVSIVSFCSIVSPLVSCSEKPTIGASSVVFSLIGMYLRDLWMTGHPGKTRYTLSIMALMMAQFLIGQESINHGTHIIALTLSFVLAWIVRKSKI